MPSKARKKEPGGVCVRVWRSVSTSGVGGAGEVKGECVRVVKEETAPVRQHEGANARQALPEKKGADMALHSQEPLSFLPRHWSVCPP